MKKKTIKTIALNAAAAKADADQARYLKVTALLDKIDAKIALGGRVEIADIPSDDIDVLRITLRETACKIRQLREGLTTRTNRYSEQIDRLNQDILKSNAALIEASNTIDVLKAVVKVLLK